MPDLHPERKGEKGSGTVYVWGGTLVLAVAIIGVCAFIAMKNRAPQTEKVAIQQAQQAPEPVMDLTEKPEPAPAPIAQRPVIAEPPPVTVAEPEDSDAPPQLLLNNLAGTLSVNAFGGQESKLSLEHTCYRSNLSPALGWSGAPPQTRSFVVFMERREQDKNPFVTWIVFNIPGDFANLKEALPKEAQLEHGLRQAQSDNNNIGYYGPCEAKGRHLYALRVFALDTVLDLPPGAIAKDDLIRAMNGHIVDAAEKAVTHYYKL